MLILKENIEANWEALNLHSISRPPDGDTWGRKKTSDWVSADVWPLTMLPELICYFEHMTIMVTMLDQMNNTLDTDLQTGQCPQTNCF